MIFETHAHYDDESFNDDREALIRSLPEKGIGRIINVGASIETTKTTLELAAKYNYIYAAVGVHPSDISGLNEETFAWLKEQASLPKTVAIGEIGLDYYWDKEPESQNAQRYWFRRQMELGNQPSGDHPFQRCSSRYHGSDERGSRRGDTGCHPLLFLLQRDGTGLYQNGLLHRCRWRCHIQKRKKTKRNSGGNPIGAHFA